MDAQNKTKDMMVIAMFTAVISVLSIIQIPMPSGVPITLQTFSVSLSGFVMGGRKGMMTTALYMLIGAVGLPVFAGMRGGFGVILGPTGGFLWGFLVLSFASGWEMERKNSSLKYLIPVAGLLICHVFGTVQFAIVSGSSIGAAVLAVSLPYMLKDLLSVAGAAFVGRAVRNVLLGQGMKV